MNIEEKLLRIQQIQEYFEDVFKNAQDDHSIQLNQKDHELAKESFDLKQEIIEVIAKESTFTLASPLLKELLIHVQSYELDIAGEIVNGLGVLANEVIDKLVDPADVDLAVTDYMILLLEKEKNKTYCMASQKVLITNIKTPNKLSKFITEAKANICDENYNAVFSLCRTILEIALKDVGIRTGIVEDIINSRQFYKKYPPYELIDSVSKGQLCGRIHLLYDSISPLVHGYKTVGKVRAIDTYEETLDVIEELYNQL